MPQGAVTVLLADDDGVSRLVLQRALEGAEDLEIVAICRDGDEALEMLLEHRPEVAVLDRHMPGLDGPDVAARARQAGLDTRFVLLSADVADVDGALVDAVVEKGTGPPTELAGAVRAAARGGPA